MTENTAARKSSATPAKTAPAARKSAVQKKAPAARSAKPAVSARAKPEMPAAIPVKSGKKAKKEKKVQDKSKVVRDSFTMPQNDYDKIAELKQVCQKAGLHVKKSELLRAGLQALSKLSVTQLERAIVQLAPIKTGRPKKS